MDTTASKAEELVEGWRTFAFKANSRHSDACDHFQAWDTAFSVTSALLATVTGSAIVAGAAGTNEWAKIGVGAIGLGAAALAGVQATLKWGARGERHRQASRQYGAIARTAEEFLAIPPAGSEIESAVNALKKALDEAASTAPNVPPRIWDRRRASDDHPGGRLRSKVAGEAPRG